MKIFEKLQQVTYTYEDLKFLGILRINLFINQLLKKIRNYKSIITFMNQRICIKSLPEDLQQILLELDFHLLEVYLLEPFLKAQGLRK